MISNGYIFPGSGINIASPNFEFITCFRGNRNMRNFVIGLVLVFWIFIALGYAYGGMIGVAN
jgi:hypothetical protein